MTRAALGLAVLLSCTAPDDPSKVCPDAMKRGFAGPGVTPCWIAAAQDRATEFKKANGLVASCPRDRWYFECSGVTKSGAPVKFKCDGRGCEFIAAWAW